MYIDRSTRPGDLFRLLGTPRILGSRRGRFGLAAVIPLAMAMAMATGTLALNNRFPSQGDLALVNRVQPSDLVHVSQAALNQLENDRINGRPSERFLDAFEDGDELFDHEFLAQEGGGANVGNGMRYTRMPRADLQWASLTPARATGPNAANCAACHSQGASDGSGSAAQNVHRDPNHAGPSATIQRNTPHLRGLAGLQILAEEMTADLQDIRRNTRDAACGNAGFAQANLTTKGVNFGVYRASRTSGPQRPPCPINDASSTIQGIDRDLVVKPFQWKGTVPTVRLFVRDAMHNELGVDAVEFVGAGTDGDADGVSDELSIGDMTAAATYMATQSRPTTKLELNSLGLLTPALTSTEISQINRGSTLFNQIGCATCHVRSLTTEGRTFSEPSQNANYREATFPNGQTPSSQGVTPSNPIFADLTRDLPDNRRVLPNTNGDLLGSFRRSDNGMVVENLGDLKRHRMGNDLAEAIDEVGTGADSFMTENLWGAGSTAPYLHDGRATTLTEAILYHTGTSETINGQAQPNTSRNNFNNLSTADKQALIAFLNNLVLFDLPEA